MKPSRVDNSFFIKFFIVQAFLSVLLLFSVLISTLNENFLKVGVLTYSVSLFGKIGLFPFLSWVLELRNEIRVELFLIMCYLQKILPFLGLMANFIFGGSFLLFRVVTILLSIKNMLFCISVNIFIANLRVFSSCVAVFFSSSLRNLFTYMILILIRNYLLIFKLAHNNFSFISNFRAKGSVFMVYLILLSIINYPPAYSFFLKVELISIVWNLGTPLLISFYVVLSTVIIFIVVRFFSLYFMLYFKKIKNFYYRVNLRRRCLAIFSAQYFPLMI